MPNISYLRELSLIKRGYTPSEAKSIVDNENILKFQSQSEETKNAYRNYYAGLFTNSGSSVKGVSITPYSVKASSLGLSSRQPNAFIGGDITQPADARDYISRGIGLGPSPINKQNTNFGTGLDITTNAPVQGFKPRALTKNPFVAPTPEQEQMLPFRNINVGALQETVKSSPLNTPIEEIQAPVVAKPLKPISLSANFLLPTREQAFKNIPGIRQSQLNFYTNISPKEKDAEIATINNLTGLATSLNLKDQPIKPIFNESLSGLLDPTKPFNERILDGQKAIAEVRLAQVIKALNEGQKPIFGKDQTKAINYIKAIMSNLQTDKSTNDLYNMADKISDSEEDFKTDYFQNIFEKQDPKLMGPPSITRHNSLLGPRIPKILGKSEYDIFMELATPDIYSFDSKDPSKIKLNDKGIALQAVLKSKSEREALSVLAPEQYTWAKNYITGLVEKLQTAVKERPIKAQVELEKEYTKEIPVPPRLSYLSTVAETNPNLLTLAEKKEHDFLVDQYNKQIDDKRGRVEFLQKELDKRSLFFSALESDLDIYSPVKNHWVSKIARETLEIHKAKQSAYDQLYYGNFKDLGIISKDKDLIFGGESILRTAGKVASGLENWWDRTISNPLASEALKDAYLSKDVSDREYRELLKDYLQTDDYPIFDKVASEQAGRLVGAGEFIYFKKKGKLLGFLPLPAIGVGTGFTYEGPGIVVDMFPSLVATWGVGALTGGAIKGYSRYAKAKTFKRLSEAEKIAETGTRASQVAELLTANARTQRILKAAEAKNWHAAYKSFSQSAIAAQGTWIGKQTAKLLYNSTPTMIGIGATTYHKIYRQTLKQYYNEGVENAEEKAAATAKLLTAVEMITEGLNPDINYFFSKGTLDADSFFGKLVDYFGGKKIQSVQDYRRIISMLDINPKSADVFARMLHWTKKSLDQGAVFTKVMAKTGMNFNEGLEEVLASLGGHAVELMQFPVTGIQPEELSAETLLNDFVGGMFLTGPMGIMQLGNYFEEEKLQRAYRMAINPEVHKSKINNLLANGKISQDQAVKALLQIDNLNKVFQDSTFDNLVNEATFLDDKEAQYQYFKDKVNKEGLNKFMETEEFANLSEEEKEKVVRNAEEISKDIQSFKRRADAFSNLSKEEKEARLKKIADKNLKIVSKGSLYEMEIALESQRREKAIARINARPVFEKIKGPMEYMENELIRMIDERKAVIKNAKDNNELNPLFEDVYLSEEAAPKSGILANNTSEVLAMLMQAAVNPDTKNILRDLRKNLVMKSVKEKALNKITEQYLKEQNIERVEALSQPQTEELTALQESASATYAELEQQEDALYEGILEKFAPSVTANVISKESLEEGLSGALLDLEFIDSLELTPEQQINFKAFVDLLQNTEEARLKFAKDIVSAETAEEQREIRENLLAEQKRARTAQPEEEVKTEEIEEEVSEVLEVIPNVEFDTERTKNLTDFDSNIQRAADIYVGSKDARQVAGKRTILTNYIVNAPTREQAIERAMFVLSLTNQSNEQTQKLITELFTNPVNFFGELSFISALKSLGKFGEALAKKEAQIKTFQTAEIVEETPIVIEETPVEPIQEEETEIQTTTPTIPITSSSYGISYSNFDLLDPVSIDHKYAVRAKKILTTISRNLYDYQIRIVDLFTYLRETYGEQLITGKENSIQSFYEEAQAIEQIADDKERQQAQRQLKAKVDSFFANYLQGVLSPSALNYHVSEIFLGSENGLKYPKTTQKSGYEDTNIIFGVAVRDGEIAKFNEEGGLSETGAVMALTIARDETRPDMIESAIPGNILRQSVVDNKSININVPILGIHDHTHSPDQSVGMSLDLMKASEFVKGPQKSQEQTNSEEISKLEEELSKTKEERDTKLKEINEEIEKLQKELEEAQTLKTVDDVISENVTEEELEQVAKEEGLETVEEAKEAIKAEVVSQMNDKTPKPPKTLLQKIAQKIKNLLLNILIVATFISSTSFNFTPSAKSLTYDKAKVENLKSFDNVKLDQDAINKLNNVNIITSFRKNIAGKYIIVDKNTGTAHLYEKDSLITSYQVGVGENVGDEQTVLSSLYFNSSGKEVSPNEAIYVENGVSYLKEGYSSRINWEEGNKKTGAGIYKITKEGKYAGQKAFYLANERGISVSTALHRPVNVVRAQRLKDTNPENNRFSNGCLKFNLADLANMDEQGITKGSAVYILPDDPNNKYEIVDGKLVFKSNNVLVNRSLAKYEAAPITIKADNVNDQGKEFLQTLSDSKSDIMSLYPTISNDEYNQIVKIAYGIFGQESSFGTYGGPRGQYGRVRDLGQLIGNQYFGKTYNPSLGVTQIRFSNVRKEVRNKFGIAKPADLLKVEKAAQATIAHLLDIYVNEIPTDLKARASELLPLAYSNPSIFVKFKQTRNENLLNNAYIKNVNNNAKKVSVYLGVAEESAQPVSKSSESSSDKFLAGLGLLALLRRRKNGEEISDKLISDKEQEIKNRIAELQAQVELETKKYLQKIEEIESRILAIQAKTEDKKPIVTVPVQQLPSVEPSDIEANKADIERRRQEELDTNTSAGYGVIASDYLFTGGRGSMLSTDYLLQALTASFPFAGKQIDAIRNKYASKLGNISDDVNTKSYNDAIAEIREAINTTYQNSEIESLFDEILNNSTGFISREGNRVSSRLEALNEEHQNKINAKYDAELAAQQPAPIQPSATQAEIDDIKKRAEVRLAQVINEISEVTEKLEDERKSDNPNNNRINTLESELKYLLEVQVNINEILTAKDFYIGRWYTQSRKGLGIVLNNRTIDAITFMSTYNMASESLLEEYNTKLAALESQAQPSAEPTPQAPSDGIEQDVRTANDFANENEFYRVIVGDESFNDILESGLVRTNAKNKGGQSLADKLASRPTLFPSFSKGRAAMDYANSNENHYIIVSEDQSIQPSTKGRHGKGTTMFPTDANGNPMESISGDKVKVYKHLGNGKYELVYANGKAIEQSPNATLQAAPFTPSEAAKKIIAATNQEFSIVAIENVIRDTNAVPTPEGYLVNGKLYVSQSNYNKTSDGVTPQEDVDKAAFAVGDFVDLLGKDILLGIENVSKAEYEQRVIEKQNLTGNFTVPDALFYGLKSSFRAWKNVIESNGGKIFAQDMVLHSEFKSPNTSIKEGTTYYGVAGRPDIVIVDKKGQIHIVDMKNIKFGSEKGSRQYETDRRDVFAPITSNKQKRKDYWQTQQNTYAMMASGLLPEISSINILGIQSAYTTKDTGIEVTNLDIINFEDIANNSTIPLVGKLSLTAIQNRQKIASEFVARNPLTFVENTSNVPQSERPLCS